MAAAQTLLPLESLLQTLAVDEKSNFPDDSDYFLRYSTLVSSLRRDVYSQINPGLACLSKSPGIYTDHGPAHFDEVVLYAGHLLGNPTNVKALERVLSPYELYILLCAIRLHDAGNIDGRDEHERRADSIIATHGGLIAKDAAEAHLIGEIASAHGGKTLSGGKDTIRELPNQPSLIRRGKCRSRRVAALVRFADEICEHEGRASSHHIANETLPDQNKLFHYYAHSIAGVAVELDSKCLRLQLRINAKYLSEPYPLPQVNDSAPESRYLLDEIYERITKLDSERLYCNQFLPPEIQVESILVGADIVRDIPVTSGGTRNVICDKFDIRIVNEGYPSDGKVWRKDPTLPTSERYALLAKDEWKK